MEILKRLEKQAKTVKELGIELRFESSYRGIERLVQLVIQALLDLGLMTLSAAGVSAGGYRDIALLLARLGFLTNEEANLMKAMAGLRNILVHGYARVNRKIVIESSKRLPDDATKLAERMVSSAKQTIKDPPKNLDDILKKLRRALKGKVKLAFIFGSKIKGYKLKGDVDIAVYFSRQPDPYEIGRIMYDIQEALGREDIDLIVIDDCDNLALAYEAVHGKPILGNEVEVLELRTKIASQHMDYLEELKKIKRLMKTQPEKLS